MAPSRRRSPRPLRGSGRAPWTPGRDGPGPRPQLESVPPGPRALRLQRRHGGSGMARPLPVSVRRFPAGGPGGDGGHLAPGTDAPGLHPSRPPGPGPPVRADHLGRDLPLRRDGRNRASPDHPPRDRRPRGRLGEPRPPRADSDLGRVGPSRSGRRRSRTLEDLRRHPRGGALQPPRRAWRRSGVGRA